ncbi:gamma carbonic anhydrase family protein [Sporichthya sp.]|uniref:gamma carbonic anhydrase family protein n=1 Tax=Sporichthya sp. TaxID=65475 RepID=UPI001847625A|nr:gamma carbonic anhydrase family protein [Sporichthya sp.]MBA3745310.1 gamma carbonic anhydrase family protein [Sporichthya sp.]
MAIYALGDLAPQIDPSAYVSPDAVVIGNVVLGPESSIWPGAVLRGDHGLIEVGARTSIQDGSIVHTTEHWPTLVGPDCVVGHLVHLEGCTIGERSLIGSGSIVMNRVTVAPRAVVGAAALVAEDSVVPSNHMAIGVPATVRPIPDPVPLQEWMTYAIDFYVSNAAKFAKELRRLD